MSHALEGLNGPRLPHGTLNAILLPHVLEFNAPAVSHRFAALRDAVSCHADVALPDAIRGLGAMLGLPDNLSHLGIDDATVRRAAPMAEGDYTNSTNPRRASADDYTRLMRAAL